MDEAHATGVIGVQGEGVVQSLGLSDKVFARVVTFGKALGAHGACVLGTDSLKSFLINFCRPLIFLPDYRFILWHVFVWLISYSRKWKSREIS